MLRGIAAILVTVFHAGLRFDPSESTFRIGNAGVDVFFVISGFVMWTVAARRPVSPGVFLAHRALRLIPLYWGFTLLLVAMAVVAPIEVPRLALSTRHVLLSLAFIPHTAPLSVRVSPVLGQGWTLNFEMFFYLLFAASLALPSPWRLAALTAALAGLTAAGFAIATPALPVTSLLSPLLIEFLFGLLLAKCCAYGLRMPAAYGWAAAALGVVLLLRAAPGAADDLARLVQYGIPAALIVGGLAAVETAGGFGAPRVALLLGDASYSIYLSHTFAISVLGKIWPAGLPPIDFILAATPVAVGTGVIVYILVERPGLRVMRRLIPRRDGPDEPGTIEAKAA